MVYAMFFFGRGGWIFVFKEMCSVCGIELVFLYF